MNKIDKPYRFYWLGPIGLIIDAISRLFRVETSIDWNARNAEVDKKIGENLMAIKIEQQKLRLKSDEYRAKMQPEIQCDGCGYFHNVWRCPKCTRTVSYKPKENLRIPPDDGRLEWISAGSANVTQAIKNSRDFSRRAVADCNTDEIFYT